MQRIVAATVAWAVLVSVAYGQLPPKEGVADFLQKTSVTLKSTTSQGSGTLVIVPIENNPVTFCWTAAHVVNDLRSVNEVITPDGTKRQIVSFKDAQVVQELIEDGRRVGELKMDARIVVFSEKEDLALLEVRKKGFAQASAVFYKGADIPKVGADIYHCGSPGGQEIGAASCTQGIIAQVGRTFSEFTGEFDQSDCAAMPGSSGGAICLRDGQYIGMLTLGVRGGDNFHYYIPIRRMKAWSAKMKVAWALGDGTPPTKDQLRALPVEDTGTMFKDSAKKESMEVNGLYYLIWPSPTRAPRPALGILLPDGTL